MVVHCAVEYRFVFSAVLNDRNDGADRIDDFILFQMRGAAPENRREAMPRNDKKSHGAGTKLSYSILPCQYRCQIIRLRLASVQDLEA